MSGASRITKLGSEAISPTRPAGDWIRFDSIYDELKVELGNEDSHWPTVVDLSIEILETLSKDLKIAGCLCIGLFHVHGYRGIPEGLRVFTGLVDNFWEELYPELFKTHQRNKDISWFAEALAKAVEDRAPEASDFQAIEVSIQALDLLEELLSQRFDDDAERFGKLNEALKRRQQTTEPSTSSSGTIEPPAPIFSPRVAPSSPGDSPGAPSDEAPHVDPPFRTPLAPTATGPPRLFGKDKTEVGTIELESLLRIQGEALASLRKLARQRRHLYPADPLSYRMARFAAWGCLISPPEHDNGITDIPEAGSAPEIVRKLDSTHTETGWLNLLDWAESEFESAVLRIDLQRIIWHSLMELGTAYDRVREVIERELVDLLLRLPEMRELKFSNGTPFCSDETLRWIDDVILAEPTQPVEPQVSDPTPTEGPDSQPVEQNGVLPRARSLNQEGRTEDAMELLNHFVREGDSSRERFRRRLDLVRFLLEIREPGVAITQLESMEEENNRFQLDEWEPGMTIDFLRLYLRCQAEMLKTEWSADPEASKKAERLFTRLARLDPAAALSLKKATENDG